MADKKKKVIELLSKRVYLLDNPPLPGSRNMERGVIQDAQKGICGKKKLKTYLYSIEHNDPNTTDKPELDLRKAIRDYISARRQIRRPQ